MRSGFLNASAESSAPIMDKTSRNKRKFRTDQQHQSTVTASVPVHECDAHKCNVEDVVEMPSSVELPNANVVTDCNDVKSSNASDSSNSVNGLKSSLSSLGFSNSQVGLQQSSSQSSPLDSNWDQFSEAQLEEILMSMLDYIFKDALKKIMSHNFSQEDALNAVLRNGKWDGRDALMSIVEGSLAWLQSYDRSSSATEPLFSDLKEMESHLLAEMIYVLREVRPYLSRGDAMWCLLMCDLNVLLACTMKEDSLPSSLKDGSVPLHFKDGSAPSSLKDENVQPSLKDETSSSLKDGSKSPLLKDGNAPSSLKLGNPLPLQSKGSSELPSPSFKTFDIPQALRVPCPSDADAQSFDLLANGNKESQLPFPTSGFSSSFFGKVMKACCKGASAKLSKTVQTCATLASSGVDCSTKENELHIAGLPQLTASQIQALEDHCTRVGLLLPHQENGPKTFVSCQSQKFVSTSGTASSILYEEIIKVISKQCISQCSDTMSRTCVSEQSTSGLTRTCVTKQSTCLQLGVAGGKAKGKKTKTHVQSSKEIQINLQIGSSKTDVPSNEASVNRNETCHIHNLVPSVADLSLTTEVPCNSDNDGSRDETPMDDINPCIPIAHVVDGTDSNSDERNDIMLSLLADRVKCLEAQLQDWTDWAQQKVMQATRRLTKDTAELKALRQEREEYIRLKKEKQSLEDGTMKKLAEMENALRKALNQVDRANSAAWRLESENAEVRAEMEAAKLTAAESVAVCNEATSKEMKSTKKTEAWEKQKQKLQSDLAEGKHNLSKLSGQLSLAKEQYQQTEVKWKKAKKAKEEALQLVETEKRAKETLERSIKRKEDTLQMRLETDTKHYQDEVQKLQKEISRAKLSSGLQPSITWEDDVRMPCHLDSCSAENLKRLNERLLSEISDLKQSQREVRRDRECIMCMSEEMSVVFLPCAHQILCIKCNETHQRQGLRDCPSCRIRIKQRIQVYGVRS